MVVGFDHGGSAAPAEHPDEKDVLQLSDLPDVCCRKPLSLSYRDHVKHFTTISGISTQVEHSRLSPDVPSNPCPGL